MTKVALIARRELAAYLRTWSGWVIIAVVLAVLGLAFNAYALGAGARRSSEVLSAFFYLAFGFTLVASVLLSMRLLAEERQQGTLTLLYSSPVTDGQIVLGKWVGALGFLALLLLLSVHLPLLVLVRGKVSFGHVAAGYLGLLLVGAAALALGTLGSALARTQVMAALVTAALVVALLLCWLLARMTDPPLSKVFSAAALYNQHFPGFQSGVVHLRDVVYYGLVTYVSLFAAARVLEARRWR